MKISQIALIIRKTDDGGVVIFGKGVECQELIGDEPETLILGSMEIDAKHIFTGYKLDSGNTPDNLLSGGGLDHRNYSTKII